jgi:uncharacterized protein YutE (UPF0331/DUF86 family)
VASSTTCARKALSLDDVVLNKAATIERCVQRVREEHAGDPRNLTSNLTKQDSIILNIQRAIEAAIDLSMHLVRVRRLGIPQEGREGFELLAKAGVLPTALAEPLKRMVGFRNVAVHDYRKLDLAIVEAVVARHLDELLAFARLAILTGAP